MKRLLPFIIFLFASPAMAADYSFLPGNKYVIASLIADRTSIQPPKDFESPAVKLGMHLELEPGWHVYWKNSGDSGSPTKIKWSLPDGWRAGDVLYPTPVRIEEAGGITTYGYEKEVVLFTEIFSPVEIPEDGQTVNLSAELEFLVCKENCVPGRQSLSLNIPFSSSIPLEPSKSLALFSKYLAELPEKLPSEFQLKAKVSSDNNLILNLKSKKLSKVSNPEKHIQVFPDKNKDLVLKPFSLQKTNKTSVSLVSGIEINSLNKFSGTIALSKELTGSSDKSFFWEFASPKKASKTHAKNGIPLEFKKLKGATVKETKKEPAKKEFDIKSLLIAMVSGFFAGMLLNVMPCVLPVISIKVLGFINQTELPRKEVLKNAWAFAAGILSTFLVLALVVNSLRSIGLNLGWGFQFQEPGFVLILFLIVFILSLSFFDAYTFKIPFLHKADRAVDGINSSVWKQFFEGILVTALATPCTAPFLGTALAFAFTQSSLVTIAVFLSIGAGLALPYAHLTTHPKLLSALPKPGPWEYRVKEFLGFLLLGTSVWLLFVLNSITDAGANWALCIAVALFFLLWLQQSISSAGVLKFIFSAVLFYGAIFCFYKLWPLATKPAITNSSSANGIWIDYSEQEVLEAKDNNQAVFIDFTASWCVTCKANKALVLDTEPVLKLFRDNNIKLLVADWSNRDELISSALNKYGGHGVPYYVLIPPGGSKPPVVLPTLLFKASVAEAIKEAL